MAAVGSAVGLGNIWRFPYILGKYGGGAFLLVFLLFVFGIGMVLMMSEFVIGRRSQHAAMKAYSTLTPDRKHWRFVGLLGIITCFFIVSQYTVVSGWTFSYFVDALTGRLAVLGCDSAQISDYFAAFTTSTVRPVVCLAVFALLAACVILGGVQKGIEGVSKVLMPLLLVILLVLCVRSLTLPGAGQGLSYLFKPDFSKLTSEGILAALGQALFTLSVGMGVMIIYGSYIPLDDNLLRTSIWITASDTFIAILAGVAIFPAVFSCGLEPAGGPGLTFCVLPNVFNSFGTTMGTVFAVLFFALLVIAALTSTISLFEALIAWFSETFDVRRRNATLVFTAQIVAMATVVALGNSLFANFKILDLSLFDFIDRLNTIYLPPLCALGTMVFLGWVMPNDDIRDELSNHGTLRIGYYPVFSFIVRWVAPVALLVVLVFGILG